VQSNGRTIIQCYTKDFKLLWQQCDNWAVVVAAGNNVVVSVGLLLAVVVAVSSPKTTASSLNGQLLPA